MFLKESCFGYFFIEDHNNESNCRYTVIRDGSRLEQVEQAINRYNRFNEQKNIPFDERAEHTREMRELREKIFSLIS